MNVLLIEDDQDIAEFIRMELDHEGYAVQTAQDGRSGLEKALAFDYDVILLDIMLPPSSTVWRCFAAYALTIRHPSFC